MFLSTCKDSVCVLYELVTTCLIAFGDLGSFFYIFSLYILLSGLHNKSANTEYQATSCLGLNLKLEPVSHMK